MHKKTRDWAAQFCQAPSSGCRAKFEYGSSIESRAPACGEAASGYERGSRSARMSDAIDAETWPWRRWRRSRRGRCTPSARGRSALLSFTPDQAGVLLRALNAVEQECDPSAHAEVRAIRLATKRLKKLSLAGYTLYTTCEPCPMCMSTALWAGLDRVVTARRLRMRTGIATRFGFPRPKWPRAAT